MDALVARARGGDEGAARALYERYATRLRATVCRWARDPATVDDVCQEAWLRAFRGLSRFRGDADFGTWLHSIARNAAIEWSRGERRRDERVAEALRPETSSPEPVELRIDLRRSVRELPEGMRQILWLHDVEGWTHAQIATSLGVAEGTSKSQLFKARARLRESLSPAVAVA